MSTTTIFQADLYNSEHAATIISLLSQYAIDIMGGGQDLSDEVKKNLIPAMQKREDVLVILAYVGDTPVGLSICFEGFSTFYAKPLINIHDFVVSEGYRGKGIAKSMLEKIEHIALERGCCKLTLEVLEGNKRAQHVYQNFGFSSYVLDAEMGRALFWDKKLK